MSRRNGVPLQLNTLAQPADKPWQFAFIPYDVITDNMTHSWTGGTIALSLDSKLLFGSGCLGKHILQVRFVKDIVHFLVARDNRGRLLYPLCEVENSGMSAF